MALRVMSVVATVWLLVGCAARLPTVTSRHPASPAAEPAPLVPPSDTLTVHEPVQPADPGQMEDMPEGMHGERMEAEGAQGDPASAPAPAEGHD